LNYRHVYHAGNFADVLKHVVLSLVIGHLKAKPTPFRVIDTHAGTGIYDLGSDEAQRTGEWREGIGRLLAPAQPVPDDVAEILAPYLSAVWALNPSGVLARYPGSPLVARHLMRTGDQLIANELHPDDFEQLRQNVGRLPDSKVLSLDGWMALRSLLPPKERRGVVLIDPPFEVAGEIDRIDRGLLEAQRRFEGGCFIAWYPVKDPTPINSLHKSVTQSSRRDVLRADLYIRDPLRADMLNGCGLVVLNPPYTLNDKLNILLPFLVECLGQTVGARFNLSVSS